ncbi:metal-dependent hydrolase [Candidatus Woesearchaeota archaeon]|nr:metal-dependent hydrolase [Candidatus Woesearchaeota archaeon]
MRARTHILFSVLCLLFYVDYVEVKHILLFSFLLFFAALFPDIDEAGSAIGKKTKPFSNIINIICGHRGVFHSLLLPSAAALTLLFFQQTEAAVAVFIGYVSHLVMDMITPAGIYLFYPFRWKIRGPIPVNSFFEKMLFWTFIVIISIKLLVLYSAFV